MAEARTDEEDDLPAGSFSTWLSEMRAALRGERGADVPCAGCTACCRASQFIPIGPDEHATLGHIPAELLFPAPHLPPGHVVLGYDERGHCPMLVDNRCSIYPHRPRTCRTYDCRLFAATGVSVDSDDPSKAEVGARVSRWRFGFPTPADRDEHDAVRAAAMWLERHPPAPGGSTAMTATRRAVMAIQVLDAFVGPGSAVVADPDPDAVAALVMDPTAPPADEPRS
jgi:hypothetical protein